MDLYISPHNELWPIYLFIYCFVVKVFKCDPVFPVKFCQEKSTRWNFNTDEMSSYCGLYIDFYDVINKVCAILT